MIEIRRKARRMAGGLPLDGKTIRAAGLMLQMGIDRQL
jgi:hypothetical protein